MIRTIAVAGGMTILLPVIKEKANKAIKREPGA
jgi:hypothetical protein